MFQSLLNFTDRMLCPPTKLKWRISGQIYSSWLDRFPENKLSSPKFGPEDRTLQLNLAYNKKQNNFIVALGWVADLNVNDESNVLYVKVTLKSSDAYIVSESSKKLRPNSVQYIWSGRNFTNFDFNQDKVLYCEAQFVKLSGTEAEYTEHGMFWMCSVFDSHLHRLTIDLATLLKCSTPFADITIVVGGDKFRAHKAMLATQSPLFDELLKAARGAEIELDDDIEPKAFKALLDCIYTGVVASLEQLNRTQMNAVKKNRISSDHLSYWKQNLATLRKCAPFADVTISVDGCDFRAHKFILSARSPVFGAMFNCGQMVESVENRVQIDDIEPNVFEILLSYIYIGVVPFRDRSMQRFAPELFIAAHKYDLEVLAKECEDFMLTNITIESASKILWLADLHNLTKLKKNAIHFINGAFVSGPQGSSKAVTKAVMATEDWKTLIKTNLGLMNELYEDLVD